MANTQTKATTKYQEKIGLVAKTYKLKKEVVEKFAETCKEQGKGVSATLTELMCKYIEEHQTKSTSAFGVEFNGKSADAVNELKKLKVFKIMNTDAIENFDDVWFRVRHECDMYEEEDIREMNAQGYKGAKNWLDRWKNLYKG